MRDLKWASVLLGALLCVIAAAAIPYVTLKLGQSVDLTMGGMFLAALVLGKKLQGKELAIELNIIQTMISAVSGVAFMVVILAAFYYIKTVFGRDIGFNPSYWQMFVWLLVSANLGVFMGIIPRKVILQDHSLPWPLSRATLNIAQTLSDPSANVVTKSRRDMLTISTGVAGFLTFLRDGLGVISTMVGNAALNISLSLEMAAVGLGMLVPLSVGLSQLLGTWVVSVFGDKAAKYAALAGVSESNFSSCLSSMESYAHVADAQKGALLTYLGSNCGKAAEFVQAGSHFKYLVQWMMWPATAMMVAAALTSVLVPLLRRNPAPAAAQTINENKNLADEEIPWWWIISGISLSIAVLMWLTVEYFSMPWPEVLLAIALQPILIIAGLRVMSITGSGPVSLMANATQFLFGLLWPAQIRSNLTAAYISASPQALSEISVPSFWVAQRLGGKFTTLILAQLIVLPIGALLTPLVFNVLQSTYGIGLEPGQLAAPTGLKIAALALVMEQGINYLPQGALFASVVGIFIGVIFELLLSTHRRRFGFIPIPAALGFALILPAQLNIAVAIGSVISAAWRHFSPEKDGTYELYAAPLASGFIAGEAIVGSILLPALALLVQFLLH